MLQMAPLIDIVFLRICFYLFVAQLISGQKDRSVELPVMVSPAARAELPAELVVNVREDGVVTVGGRVVALGHLAAILTGESVPGRQRGPAVRVVVRADRRQPFGNLDDVLAVCRECGVTQVVFRTRQGEGP